MSDLPIAPPGQKTGYRVRLAVFEGPLDLLLHLIEREELDITRVSLARVTDQYLEYLTALEELEVEDLADFVVVAARLILIKSQALLPRPPTPTPEKSEDAGDELIRQLLAYKQFKKAAQYLGDRHSQGLRSHVRVAPVLPAAAGIEYLEPVPMEALLAAAHRAMQTRPSTPDVGEIVAPINITIRDQIERITHTLTQQLKVSFTDLLTPTYSRQEVAVTLLALLELIKRREIKVRQERRFGKIILLPVSQITDSSSSASPQ